MLFANGAYLWLILVGTSKSSNSLNFRVSYFPWRKNYLVGYFFYLLLLLQWSLEKSRKNVKNTVVSLRVVLNFIDGFWTLIGLFSILISTQRSWTLLCAILKLYIYVLYLRKVWHYVYHIPTSENNVYVCREIIVKVFFLAFLKESGIDCGTNSQIS